jgi:hypothetical protein
MELNCHHYVCEQDILQIINTTNRRCPICRTLITSYGCNGNIVNVENNQINQPHIIPYENEDADIPPPNQNLNNNGYNIIGYESDGGKYKKLTRTKKHLKRKSKKRKSKKRKSKKRKSKKKSKKIKKRVKN